MVLGHGSFSATELLEEVTTRDKQIHADLLGQVGFKIEAEPLDQLAPRSV
jgi:hypothetical protein